MKENSPLPPEGDSNEIQDDQAWENTERGGETPLPDKEKSKFEPTIFPPEGYTQQDENVTPEKTDIFDDLTSLGRPLDEVIPSRKIMTSLPLRKPRRDEWVRLHREILARVYIYESKSDGSSYLVTPEVVEPLSDVVRYVQLTLAVNYVGSVFAWPVPVPTESRPHRAHLTAFAGAEQATTKWIRISWGDGEYDVFQRSSTKAEPVWPEEIKTPSEMLRFIAKSGGFEVIDSADHPVVQGHLGLD
ncbi:MAG: hypothetical protein ACSHYB_05175 [Roseibacillus sp.]